MFGISMKKTLIMFFTAFYFSTQILANAFSNSVNKTDTIILNPHIGFSHILMLQNKTTVRETVMWGPFSFGIDAIQIKPNGFTICYNNALWLAGTLQYKKTAFDAPHKSTSYTTSILYGFMYQGQVILGYTINATNDFLITFGGGIGVQGGIVFASTFVEKGVFANLPSSALFAWNIGFPVQIGFQYFFNETVGVSCSTTEQIGFGGGEGHKYFLSFAFTHTFSVRAGLSFRL